MNRRGFLKFFGIGTVVTAVSPTVIADAQIMASRMPSPKHVRFIDGHCKMRSFVASGSAVNPGQTVTLDEELLEKTEHWITSKGWKRRNA